MSKHRAHLARLAPHIETIAAGDMAEQYGALCFRYGEANVLEVLLITTRETKRWMIPKGWPIKGLDGGQVAEREAWEEAGVKGKIKNSPFGYFTYLKAIAGGKTIPSVVEVHLLHVRKQYQKFPESGQRLIEWMMPEEAARRVREPELKGLLMRFALEQAGPVAAG
ncbi:DNA mismatch repair protein MutT [Rhizobium sp. JAB6]|jgi:8-oxo-dGTP pyrophosphatase MutT (NUDIX family)|uniref:NUDIX hydrolase n=1 Tax=Rhizobium sp. JAB6 TaxID=2127050 RepID=UPI000D136DB9|nr:NUDIX hydrolase [Rhizobium sp. JAB6]PST19320.1 DNA mismatch repair protein MutT [Rhizobium sp. JAB6]